MKLLLTGGTGFIGGPVSRVLKARGVDFTLAVYEQDPLLPQVEREYDVARVNLLCGESRAELLSRVKPDTLMHLAWYAEPNNFWRSPLNMNWLEAGLDILRRFIENGGTRCLMTGTCAEYDWSRGGRFSEESTPVEPSTFYGQAKDALRRAGQGYTAVAGGSFLWCRLFWPYGPGEPEGRLFSSLMNDLRAGRTAVCRAGNLRRDYMHVNDIAEALVAAVLSCEEGIMNVASGQSTALGDLALLLARAMGREDLLEIGSVETGPGNPEEIYADTGRLRRIYHGAGKGFARGFEGLMK